MWGLAISLLIIGLVFVFGSGMYLAFYLVERGKVKFKINPKGSKRYADWSRVKNGGRK